ncbi:MAG: ATP-binding protein, partial [Chloroflexota bacterium]
MLLSVLPLFLAGGLLGPVAAGIIGFLAGALRFLWDTHSIFTPLEMALLSILFSLAINQRYRTRLFSFLREPLVAAFCLTLFYAPVFIIDSFLVSSGSMAARLDYALTGVGLQTLAVGSELFLAGLFMQVLVMAFPASWGRNLPLQPSPMERSLEARFMFGTATLIIVLLLALLAGDWLVAGSAAREMLYNRLKGTAETSAQSIPFFLETGQTLAAQIAKRSELREAVGDDLSQVLQAQVESIPYFDQILVFDNSKKLIAYSGYLRAEVGPGNGGAAATDPQLNLYPEENAALDLSANGVLSQTYSIPPLKQDMGPARISFIIAIPPLSSDFAQSGSRGGAARTLIARTDLATNPFILPLITSLKSMSELGGSGSLLDEHGRVLYHPVFTQVMNQYTGLQRTAPALFDEVAPNGTRNLVYYQPVIGRSWAIVLTVPAQQTQQLALAIAAPLSGLLLLLAGFALIFLRLSVKGVTTSLQTLAAETVRISQGQLDHALALREADEDEVGQLRRAFEQMRLSLKDRMAELNRLLLVSQGVASSLDVQIAVQPILEAVLATGASAVRIVAQWPSNSEVVPSLAWGEVVPLLAWGEETGQSQTRFAKQIVLAIGPKKDFFAQYDQQVISLARNEKNERVFRAASDAARTHTRSGSSIIAAYSFFAIVLRHENQFFGVLWAAYDQSREFSDSDERFLTTLAGQAALAASNHYLFRTAEVGRERLAAILASTPDPVLVTDQFNHLLLANPAAVQVFGSQMESGKGQPVEQLINQPALLEILAQPRFARQIVRHAADGADEASKSIEVTLAGTRVYLATASPVIADNRSVGRVCILRDVTHFKELDSMKTEFVNTVSHDLRSPLTLIRGYATMLETIGTLNEQQTGYARKIISSVEHMAHLINTLLDLGRVEAGVGLQLELVSLIDMIEQVTGPLQLMAFQKNIEFSLNMPSNIRPMIEVDKALFQQVIYNLVENALKYTPDGGKVALSLHVKNNHALFEVQDSGIGVDPRDKPRLFEKFYRSGQREAREQKGTGLGLAIVKTITEVHGGKVWFESQLGKGSTFFLQVPLRQLVGKAE